MEEDKELYIREQLARIDNTMAESHKFAAEERKLFVEERKLLVESFKLNRGRWWYPWLQLVTTVISTIGSSAVITAIILHYLGGK